MIRQSDIAIAHLIECVARKTVVEYNRNRKQLRKSNLDEQKAKEKETAQQDTRSETTSVKRDNEQPGSSNTCGTKTPKKSTQIGTTKSPERKSKLTK